VPRHTQLKVDVFSSNVRVRNLSGEQSIKTFSGDLLVEDGAARVQAKTFSGAIDVRLVPAVTSPELDLETFSGPIDLKVSNGARAALNFDSFSGRLTSDLPLTLSEQRKGHLRADLNGGDPQRPVRLKTFSGDVKLGR
jgi:DUF4097 and DUF4098 domain-containing protein YvlB